MIKKQTTSVVWTLLVQTNKNLIKVLKVYGQQKKIIWFYNFCYQCNSQPNYPSLLPVFNMILYSIPTYPVLLLYQQKTKVILLSKKLYQINMQSALLMDIIVLVSFQQSKRLRPAHLVVRKSPQLYLLLPSPSTG